MCERWVRDWTKTATYWPQFLRLQQHFFLVLLVCSTGGPEGPVLCWVLSHCLELQQLTPNSKLTWTSRGTRLYNCLTPTYFSERRICTQFHPSTVKVIHWYLRPDAPVIYIGAFLIWQFGRVGGQYVTFWKGLNFYWRFLFPVFVIFLEYFIQFQIFTYQSYDEYISVKASNQSFAWVVGSLSLSFTHSLYIYMYIYIYMCVCVCVCLCVCVCVYLTTPP